MNTTRIWYAALCIVLFMFLLYVAAGGAEHAKALNTTQHALEQFTVTCDTDVHATVVVLRSSDDTLTIRCMRGSMRAARKNEL